MPTRNRTWNLQLRRLSLYPIELWAQIKQTFIVKKEPETYPASGIALSDYLPAAGRSYGHKIMNKAYKYNNCNI
jgi:hypothetical protein